MLNLKLQIKDLEIGMERKFCRAFTFKKQVFLFTTNYTNFRKF